MLNKLDQHEKPHDAPEHVATAAGLWAAGEDQLHGLHPWRWALGLVLVCTVPLVLIALGVDLSSGGVPILPEQATELTTSQFNDSMHHALCGSFTHTLLEWTAVCAALFVCILTLVQFKMTREPSLPVIGMALVCAGTMDAFHTLAADRLISSVADNRDLIPFTWAICRLFNALILLLGVGIFAFTARRKVGEWGLALIALISSVFMVAAYLTVHWCATSGTLPNTMFPESSVKRPYDIIPLIPYLLCGLVVFPKYFRRHRTLFACSLLLSLIPQIATQLYMAFGSFRLHDAPFNIAHALKALAYGVPMLGMAAEYIRTHQQREQATAGLLKAHAELEIRVQERTAQIEQTSRQLAESEARTRGILQTAAEGIISINDHGIIESFNASASTIFGYTPEEVIGQNISMLMPSPHQEQHDEYLARYLRTGESKLMGIYRELEGKRKDGTLFPANIAVSEVQIDEHRTFTGIVRDLTVRKKLQSQLAQAQKMESIGQLAAGIAHEINTPTQYVGDNTRFLRDAFGDLNKFLGSYDHLLQATKNDAVTVQLIADVEATLKDLDPEYLEQEIPVAIQQSLEGVEHIARLVRAMKDFCCTAGDQKTPVDLNQSIENTITVASSEWRCVAEVICDLDDNLPLVPCIARNINQVFLHLIVNAAHAIADVVGESDQKGTIRISTHHEDDWVEIRIRDTGTGIPEECQPRIFDPFFTTKEVGKGAGQGLHVCYSVIVEEHGGTIKFETELGQGTNFIIRLPLVEAPNHEPQSTEEQAWNGTTASTASGLESATEAKG